MPWGEEDASGASSDPLERPTLPERFASSLPPARLESGEVVARRFEVLELLGTGGYGEVYRVHDRRADREMAIKIHRVGALGPRARSVLEAEFELLSGLQHPNLVGVEEFGVTEGHYAWLSQPRVQGLPLHHVHESILSPRGLQWLAQLLRALDYLHGRGFVHGDVKPLNVLVDESTGRLVLLDFGVARTLGAVSPEYEGSPDYMAPEVIHGLPADGRSDLYGLGCTVHTLITGTPPFYRPTARETFLAHVLSNAPPLPESVPPPLREWVGRLLRKRTGERFQSAWEALRALGEATGNVFHRDTPATLASHVARAPLTGRDELLETLVAAAQSEEARFLCLEGPLGSGKSRLVEEFRRHHQMGGGRFLQVHGLRDRMATWRALARAVLDPYQVRVLDDDSRRALSRVLPELRLAGERPSEPMDLDGAARKRARILGELLASRSRRQRLVLAIDDLHNLGSDEQLGIGDVLEHARAAGLRGAVLLTAVPGGLSPEWPKGDHSSRLAIPPLEPGAMRAIVDALVGLSVVEGTELAAGLFARPRTPFEVRETIRLLVDEGRIVRGATGRFERVSELPWREPRELFGARIQRLGKAARTAAAVLAVWARPANVAELARVAGLEPGQMTRGLGELLERGLAEREERFRRRPRYVLHEAYVAAVLASAPREHREAIARRAADEVLRHGRDVPGELARAAAFLESAQDEGAAAALFRRASDEALRAGRPDEALDFSRNLARLESPLDPARLLREHDLALRLGRTADADEALEMAKALGAADGDLTWREGHRDVRAGQVGRARERCLGRLPSATGETRVRLLEVLGRAEALAGEMEQSWHHFHAAQALAERLGIDASAALLGRAVAEQRLGRDESSESARIAVEAARSTQSGELLSDAERAMGSARRARGDQHGAERAFQRALELARARADVEREARALVDLGRVALDRAQVGRTIELWEHAVELDERVGAIGDALVSRLRLASVLKACGRPAEALECLEPVLEGEALGLGLAVGLAWSQRGDLHALDGDDERALESYGRANAILRPHPVERAQALAGRLRTLIRRGELGRAATDLQLLQLLAEETGRPLDRRRHAVCAARLAEELGEAERALEHARASITMPEPTRVYVDVHGTHLEGLWLVARSRAALGRSSAHASRRAQGWLARHAEGFETAEGARRFRAATPTRRAIGASDLAARW